MVHARTAALRDSMEEDRVNRTRRGTCRSLAIAAIAMVFGVGADAQSLYGLSSSVPGSLYTIDTSTGAATLVANLSGASDTSLVGLEFLGGTLYATDVIPTSGPFAGSFTFGTIDPITGAYTAINNQAGSSN